MSEDNQIVVSKTETLAVTEYLNLQREDLKLRSEQHIRESELEKLRIEADRENFELMTGLTEKTLHASAKERRDQFIFWGVICLIFLVFCSVLVFKDKPEAATDLLKLVIGGVAGYFIGAFRAKPKNSSQPDGQDD